MSSQQRSSSLSLRQGIGIAFVLYGSLQLLVAIGVGLVIPVLMIVGKMEFDGLASVIGMVIGLMIVMAFVALLLMFGIYLLEDKKGMYIKFLMK